MVGHGGAWWGMVGHGGTWWGMEGHEAYQKLCKLYYRQPLILILNKIASSIIEKLLEKQGTNSQ
jgi:hypothetical protein